MVLKPPPADSKALTQQAITALKTLSQTTPIAVKGENAKTLGRFSMSLVRTQFQKEGKYSQMTIGMASDIDVIILPGEKPGDKPGFQLRKVFTTNPGHVFASYEEAMAATLNVITQTSQYDRLVNAERADAKPLKMRTKSAND